MHRVLVCDDVAPEGIAILEKVAQVEAGGNAVAEGALAKLIAGADALIVRSATRVTRPVLEAGANLRVVARAGVGVDNIDLEAATERGIVVVNSPEGNTIAAAEHTIALIMSLQRRIPQAHASMVTGHWDRKSYMGVQVWQKCLGLVGCGKVGGEVARRAKGLGMEVIVYDPYLAETRAARLGVRLLTLEELLRAADVVSIHAARQRETVGLIGASELALMKPSAVLVNTARGGIVDEQALAAALGEGRIAGAALDVFAEEGHAPAHLIGLPNIVLTPHLGASTTEAQVAVAVDVAEQVVEVLEGRIARSPVNVPAVSPETLAAVGPYIPLVTHIGQLHSALLRGPITRTVLAFKGELAEVDVTPLKLYFLVGLLSPKLDQPVNFVNAPHLAEQWGVQIVESRGEATEGYASLFSAMVESGGREVSISGTEFGTNDVRIVEMNGYRLDVRPEGCVLFIWHRDQPGVIGLVGTLLGNSGVNIAGMQVGRSSIGGPAVMALLLDDPLAESLVAAIRGLPGIEDCLMMDFG